MFLEDVENVIAMKHAFTLSLVIQPDIIQQALQE